MFATPMFRLGYRHILKPLFFRRDPEEVHDRMTAVGERLGRSSVGRTMTAACFRYRHPALEQTILGIRFPNPVGLTAGFDKDARMTDIMPAVGFGFEEIGSVTGEPCEGNPKPRLWRLPKSQGLVVYYGLKNDGADAISRRLQDKRFEIPVGVSVAKTNSPTTVDVTAGVADYEKAFRAFLGIGDYFTLNVSCPNAFGGEPFGTPERLDLLLSAIDAIETKKPIFVKLQADLTTAELDALVAVMERHRVHGVILTNLTKRRDRPTIVPEEIKNIPNGGISGKPVFDPSNDLISYLYRTRGRRFVIIGSGGVFTAEDAYEKIRRGASLIQLATGMIFRGPQAIGEINRDLVRLLKRDGYANVSDAVGAASR